MTDDVPLSAMKKMVALIGAIVGGVIVTTLVVGLVSYATSGGSASSATPPAH